MKTYYVSATTLHFLCDFKSNSKSFTERSVFIVDEGEATIGHLGFESEFELSAQNFSRNPLNNKSFPSHALRRDSSVTNQHGKYLLRPVSLSSKTHGALCVCKVLGSFGIKELNFF